MAIKSGFISMKKRSQTQTILLYFISLIIPFFLSFIIIFIIPFNIPNKIALGFIIGIIALLVSMKFNLKLRMKIKIYTLKNSRLIFTIIYSLLIILVIIKNFFLNELKVLPNSNFLILIPFFLISSLITAFMSGYAIIEIISIGKYFRNLEKILYAIMLSILITCISGFIAWNMGDLAKYSNPIFIGINFSILVIFICFIIKNKFKKKKISQENTQPIEIDLLTFSILAFIIFFLIFSYFTIHQESISHLLGDEYDHVGYIVKLMKNLFSWQESSLMSLTTPSYPYFFHLFHAVTISLSNLSIINSYTMSSIYLLPLPMLSLFSLARNLTKSNRISLLATLVFQMFSGFGWIIAIKDFGYGNEIYQILSVSNCTCDIIFSTWFPVINAPYLLDITTFLLILNLITKKKINSNYLSLLILPLLLLSILTHFVNTMFLIMFIIGIMFLEIIFDKKFFRTKEFGLALIISVVIVIFLDLLAIKSLFTSYPPLLISLLICITSGLFIFLVSKVRFKSISLLKNSKNFLISHPKKIFLLCGIFFVCICFYEIIYGVSPKSHCSFIPLYYLPLKLGFGGIFLIIWGLTLSKKKMKEQYGLFFLLLIIMGGGILLFHIPVLSSYNKILGVGLDEFRFIRDLTWPFVSIAAGIGIKYIIEKVRGSNKKIVQNRNYLKRIVLCSIIIGLIIGPSSISHLLKIEYMTDSNGINKKDENIANYIENMEIESGASIYALYPLKSMIYSLTGATVYTELTPIYGNILSKGTDSPSILFTLRYLNISYLIVSKNEDKTISSKIYNYFPIVYEDNDYKIYKLPKFSYPNFFAENTMLLGDSQYPEISASNSIYKQNYLWVEDFEVNKNWEPDYSTFQNCIFQSIESNNNNTILINCEGTKNSKIVMFYKYILEKPIHVDNETYLWSKFRTQMDTKLMIHILYSDGTMSNSFFEGSPYMTSKRWSWSQTLINYVNKNITGFRIGISNIFDESVNKIWAELDYLVISKHNNTCFRDGIMTVALSNTNYTIEYNTAAPLVEEKYQNIILTNNINSSEIHTYLTDILLKDKKVMVLGDLTDSGWILNYLDLEYNEELVSVNNIEFNDINYNFPSINVPHITLTNGHSIAWYSGNEKIPFIVDVSINSTLNFYYVNIWPIIDAIKEKSTTTDLFSFYEILNKIFSEILNLTKATSIKRAFYQKNKDSCSINGSIKIECLNPHIFTVSSQELSKYGGKYFFEVIGEIEIFSLSYGLCLLNIKGSIKFQDGNTVLFESKYRELKVTLKVIELSGEGKINFTSFYSGFPYKLSIANKPYETNGEFELKLFPISAELLFLLPNEITGGWWRTIEP